MNRNLQESQGDDMIHEAISLEEIKKAVEKQIHHSYLDKFIEPPVIDQEKLFLLIAIFQETSYTVQQQKQFIVTSMLVQIALDTHDKVSLDDSVNEPDQKKKKRQLTVLAGDYYSGLYYYLLSNLEDFQMIKTLASAIKELNEAKMSVYYKQHITIEELLTDIQHIESLLVRRMAEYAGKVSINRYAEDWLLLNKLLKERETILTEGSTQLYLLIGQEQKQSLEETNTIEIIDEKIEKLIKSTGYHLNELSNQFPALGEYVSRHSLHYLAESNTKALKEG